MEQQMPSLDPFLILQYELIGQLSRLISEHSKGINEFDSSVGCSSSLHGFFMPKSNRSFEILSIKI